MSTKVRQMWFVIPSDIRGNGQQWQGPENISRDRWAEPPRAEPPARARGRNAVAEEDSAPTDTGVGIFLSPKESKEIVAFTTKSKAAEFAKHQATMNPQKLFGIYTCEQVYETTVPAVLEKKFNDAGELILSGV